MLQAVDQSLVLQPKKTTYSNKETINIKKSLQTQKLPTKHDKPSLNTQLYTDKVYKGIGVESKYCFVTGFELFSHIRPVWTVF